MNPGPPGGKQIFLRIGGSSPCFRVLARTSRLCPKASDVSTLNTCRGNPCEDANAGASLAWLPPYSWYSLTIPKSRNAPLAGEALERENPFFLKITFQDRSVSQRGYIILLSFVRGRRWLSRRVFWWLATSAFPNGQEVKSILQSTPCQPHHS
jgi:hypothetical protein